jgi:hypothetical protein
MLRPIRVKSGKAQNKQMFFRSAPKSRRKGAGRMAGIASMKTGFSYWAGFLFSGVLRSWTMSNSNLIEHLTLALDELQRAEAGLDWVSDTGEVLTVNEAAQLADCSVETVRRWASDFGIGRLFASSLWLISRRRLLAHIERRHGKAAMLAAASRGKNLHRSLSSALSIRVRATSSA